jgi:hypothetical protein
MRRKKLNERFQNLQLENEYLRKQIEVFTSDPLFVNSAPTTFTTECLGCRHSATIAVPTFEGPETWVVGCRKKTSCPDFDGL